MPSDWSGICSSLNWWELPSAEFFLEHFHYGKNFMLLPVSANDLDTNRCRNTRKVGTRKADTQLLPLSTRRLLVRLKIPQEFA